MKTNDKHIIAIIPARGESKSIPKKNIVDFMGKPLLAWSLEDAKNSEYIKEVYVSTDDEEIAKVAEQYGATVIWRPKDISGDSSPSEEALLHALSEIEKKDPKQIEYVVFLQATSPLRDAQDIDKAVETTMEEGADSLFSGSVIGDFLIWRKNRGVWESMNYDYKNRARRQDFGEQFVENGSIYVFKPKILFEQHNRLGGKIALSKMEFWKSFEIDNFDDLDYCKKLYQIQNL